MNARAKPLRFPEYLARHFKDRVKYWEIWNEPSVTHFWQPEKPNPEDYARLVAKTAPVIREQIADSFIIGAALAGVRGDYLEGCFENGLGDFVGAISYHSYRVIPEERYDRDMTALRECLAKHAPARSGSAKTGAPPWAGRRVPGLCRNSSGTRPGRQNGCRGALSWICGMAWT